MICWWNGRRMRASAELAMRTAAAELAVPTAQHHLSWARDVFKDWEVVTVPQHHIAMPKAFAVIIGISMAGMGYGRLGAGIILQQAKGLRPSELLKLRGEDAARVDKMAFVNVAGSVLNIGARAKLRRAQAKVVSSIKDSLAHELLIRLQESTPPMQFLMGGVTLSNYAKVLDFISDKLGLPRFTPDSPRAGFATDEFIEGTDFVTIRETGGWLSCQLLPVYLDAVTIAS
jgi:hypothetical protein